MDIKKYKTIYADPPWPEYGGGRIIRGAQKHYNLMSIEEIYNMKDFINKISENNCHLYLWVTNSHIKNGFKIMEEWGFQYKTKITWVKNSIGIGQYFRGMSEDCLFGIRGNLPYKIIDGKRQQGRTAFLANKTKHSEKPEEMRQMIEKVSYPPYIELFARKKIINWDSWGNEVNSNIEFN